MERMVGKGRLNLGREAKQQNGSITPNVRGPVRGVGAVASRMDCFEVFDLATDGSHQDTLRTLRICMDVYMARS
jgi:hypothetical protein